MKYQLPFFGELDLSKLEEYYETDIEFEGRTIQIDLTFENTDIGIEKFDLIKIQLTDIESLNFENRKEISKDFQEGGNVEFYVKEILEQLDDDIEEILVEADSSKSKKEHVLDAVKLKRIGFYPEVENAGIVSDYTISEELTDDLVVVFRKLDRTFDGISIES
ncbi:DUF2004 domain-containing protein [Rufibacter ruber]|uniref:DUF2004 domain-containing protein n=1 Tax=Rufibacter ruber TaxID=1783499 RepID=UPI00082CA972|nr:DUF2004 domain-containing protein [Rufibacter ruber]